MNVIIIAAIAKNKVIGKNNKLPWNIPDEMQLFRDFTAGNTVIMGRKTYESIGRPMPNRHNIVISRSVGSIHGVDVCASLEEGLEKARKHGKDIFIIGGAEIYRQVFQYADKMYLSWIKKEYNGDTFFPKFDEKDWKVVKKQNYGEFEFREYRKVSSRV